MNTALTNSRGLDRRAKNDTEVRIHISSDRVACFSLIV